MLLDVSEQSRSVDASLLDGWSATEEAQLKRLCRVTAEGTRTRLTRIQHRTGHIEVRGLRVVSRSSISGRTLLLMVLYANGLQLDRLQNDLVRSAEAETGDDSSDALVAHAMAVAARQLLQRTVAQQYVAEEMPLTALRGRPQWHRPPVSPPGVRCRFYEKRTDNALNQTILAGLAAAGEVLRRRGASTSINQDLYVWRELATLLPPKRSSVDAQLRGLNQLTHHYGAALTLARCLLFGSYPGDFLDPAGELPMPGLVLDLGYLFENVLSRMLREAAVQYGVTVESQRVRSDAILDGQGATYKQVRPDIVIRRHGRAVLILDAKFKPRYLACRSGGLRPVKKVSNEDLYQLYFYQQHLAGSGGLPGAAIVAPQLTDRLPDDRYRSLAVSSPGGVTLGSVQLLPFPLTTLLESLRLGGAMAALEQAAPALHRLIQAAAQ